MRTRHSLGSNPLFPEAPKFSTLSQFEQRLEVARLEGQTQATANKRRSTKRHMSF